MKTSHVIIRAIAAGIIILNAACSGSGSGATAPADSGDVARVTVSIATAPHALNGFEDPADSIALVAYVRDGRDNLISDRPVAWQVQLSNGAQAGDTIASIASTGPRTASLVFHSDVMVGVVASALRADGVSRSGTLYMVRTP